MSGHILESVPYEGPELKLEPDDDYPDTEPYEFPKSPPPDTEDVKDWNDFDVGTLLKSEIKEDVESDEDLKDDTEYVLPPKKTNYNKVKCEYCTFHTNTRTNLKRHMKSKHEDEMFEEMRYACDLCEYRTNSLSNLRRHLSGKTHEGQSTSLLNKLKLEEMPEIDFSCEFCQYYTNDKSNYRRHMQRKHTDKDPNIPHKYSCDFCDYTTNEQSNFKRHIASKHSMETSTMSLKKEEEDYKDVKVEFKKYNCDICDYKTDDAGNFSRHKTIKHNENAQELKCGMCDFKSIWRSSLQKHMRLTHDKDSNHYKLTNFMCNSCDFVTTQKGNLKRHLKNKHGLEERSNFTKSVTALKCSHCHQEVKNTDELNSHLQEIHPEKVVTLQCELCPFKTRYRSSMRVHSEHHRDKSGDLKCKHCEHTTSDYRSLRVHMNSEHIDQKLTCPIPNCDKSFWNLRMLISHKVKHETEPKEDGIHSCWQCNYRTSKISVLSLHIKSVHMKLKPFLCDECPASFPTRGRMYKHKRSVHMRERNFHCNVCGKDFSTKQYLIIHQRLHTGEKPHTCETCGKSFSDDGYFNQHKKSHELEATGKKLVFRCEICDKTFTAAKTLRSHMFGHKRTLNDKAQKFTNEFKLQCLNRVKEIGITNTSAEVGVNVSTLRGWVTFAKNPHRCTICDKSYAWAAKLQQHMRTHDQSFEAQKRERRTKYRDDLDYRQTVVEYSRTHSALAASIKFDVSESTLRGWRNLFDKPQECPLCGKQFAYPAKLNVHLKHVHAGTKEAAEVKTDTKVEGEEISFQHFLEDQNMFPAASEDKQNLFPAASEDKQSLFPNVNNFNADELTKKEFGQVATASLERSLQQQHLTAGQQHDLHQQQRDFQQQQLRQSVISFNQQSRFQTEEHPLSSVPVHLNTSQSISSQPLKSIPSQPVKQELIKTE